MPKEADNIEFHIWESEEHLPIDPMQGYNDKIASKTQELALYPHAILIGHYTGEFHDRTEKFEKKDIGKPYLRLLALNYANSTVPENRWRFASNDDLDFASLLDEGGSVGELTQKLRMLIQEEKELSATEEQKGQVEAGTLPKSYVIWAHKDLVANVESAAKSLDAKVVKYM